MFKLAAFASLLAGASAFAPAQSRRAATSLAVNELEIGATAPLGVYDPLGWLDTEPEAFERRRAVERKHGRVAMAAVLGSIVHHNDIEFDGYLSPSQNLKFSDIPNGVDGIRAVPTAGLLQILFFFALVELAWMPASKYDGDYGVGWFGDAIEDPEEKARKLNAEINNGRAAMMGILGIMVHDVMDGKPFIFIDMKLKKLEQPTGHSTSSGKHKMHPSPIDLTTSPALKSPGQCVIFSLQLGRGMSRARVELLSKTILAKKPDTCIVNAFNSSPSPSHVVIDPQIDAMNVASALEFDSPDKMASHFAASKIHAVTPHWVLTCDNLHSEPPIDYLWGGYRRYQSASAAKPKTNNSKKRRLQPKDRWLKSRKLDEFAPITSVKASELRDDDSSIGRLIRRREGLEEESRNRGIFSAMRGVAPKRNGALAAMFDEMADLQKQSPLEKIDEWRAYTYTMVAGRLRHLDFEVTLDADVLGSVRGIRGFGSGVMTKIKQFLATGSCDKLKSLRTDPARVAVRELTNIWGVGPKTASNLVNRGYRCIADVRRGLASGDIDLSDNARVGVDCYEDFLERMEREEVKQIGDIVAASVYKVYPEAEVSTMGSYRRGKSQSGDSDVLIVHPCFVSTTPKDSLARVLRLLERDGNIANHLTTVKTSSDGTLPNDSELSANLDSQNDQDQLSVDDEYRAATTRRSLTLGDDHPGSVSWMGVFYSPMHDGKRRRVDIKFYPYREKAFCKLYFTGSGTFNRSMRLWATKSCKMTLNDHGLFKLNVADHHQYYRMKRDDKRQSRGEIINCKTEKDIFDALGLEFRTPQKRRDFDDVVEKGSAKPISLNVSEKDFAEESRQQWVR